MIEAQRIEGRRRSLPPPIPAGPEDLAALNKRLDEIDFNLTTIFIRADDYLVMQIERELTEAGLFEAEDTMK